MSVAHHPVPRVAVPTPWSASARATTPRKATRLTKAKQATPFFGVGASQRRSIARTRIDYGRNVASFR
jgi:hypothetical protein